MSENGTMATWVGSLISPETPILLLCENKEKAKDSVERLLRIGYFNIKGYNGFDINQWEAQGHKVWEPSFVSAQQFHAQGHVNVLDVRNPGEWKSTGVIEGATLISLSQLKERAQ